jgi:16S rRNA (cytosine1402-N4)-methyltransferase
MNDLHYPVLLEETMAQLAIQPEGIYIDATFGRGGHSREILKRLGKTGMLIAIDQDSQAIESGESLKAQYPQLHLVQDSFSQIAAIAKAYNCLGRVSGIIADLGVSSPQLDEAARGFSFCKTGPLDMRMNPHQGEPVSNFIAQATEADLAEVFFTYGEERHSRRVARAIVERRMIAPIETTTDLADIMSQAIPGFEPGKHKATRCFQALRIFINRELEVLPLMLAQSLDVLMQGGRLLVISFHSLEDRIVKQFMKKASQGERLPSHIPVKASEESKGSIRLVTKAMKANQKELAENARSRSAILRVAEKLS